MYKASEDVVLQSLLKRRIIFLYSVCFSGFKSSLLTMGLAAETLVLCTIYNSMMIDSYPSYDSQTTYMVEHSENLQVVFFQ